jgi:oxygen-independent coproporphyrinogen-3 oxidase
VDALLREIWWVAGHERHPAHTLYFGGGTPSLLPAAQVETIVNVCRDAFALVPDEEITLEANPGTVDQTYLHSLRRSGVSRLSIGMQSAHEGELRLFARGHRLEDVRSTVQMARAAGFDNINLDLIYGVPHQTLTMWQHSLHTALDMRPDHLALYGLGVEDGTPMQRSIERGRFPSPDPDLAADMYEWASERLAQAGFDQYEISNWAKRGFACRHNTHYWQNRPYLGFGAGAHGYAAGVRTVTVLRPADYIARMQADSPALPFPLSPAVNSTEPVDEPDRMADTMIMGLRLTQEGVALEEFRARFGRTLWSVYGKTLDRLIGWGLVEHSGSRVRLTPRGRLVGNRVFAEFV